MELEVTVDMKKALIFAVCVLVVIVSAYSAFAYAPYVGSKHEARLQERYSHEPRDSSSWLNGFNGVKAVGKVNLSPQKKGIVFDESKFQNNKNPPCWPCSIHDWRQMTRNGRLWNSDLRQMKNGRVAGDKKTHRYSLKGGIGVLIR